MMINDAKKNQCLASRCEGQDCCDLSLLHGFYVDCMFNVLRGIFGKRYKLLWKMSGKEKNVQIFVTQKLSDSPNWCTKMAGLFYYYITLIFTEYVWDVLLLTSVVIGFSSFLWTYDDFMDWICCFMSFFITHVSSLEVVHLFWTVKQIRYTCPNPIYACLNLPDTCKSWNNLHA